MTIIIPARQKEKMKAAICGREEKRMSGGVFYAHMGGGELYLEQCGHFLHFLRFGMVHHMCVKVKRQLYAAVSEEFLNNFSGNAIFQRAGCESVAQAVRGNGRKFDVIPVDFGHDAF